MFYGDGGTNVGASVEPLHDKFADVGTELGGFLVFRSAIVELLGFVVLLS